MRIRLRSLVLVVALATGPAASGEVLVTGALDRLHVEAKQARVSEILDVLQRKFGLAYEFRARSDWIVNGVFSGPFTAILPRILRGANYVYRISADNSVTIFFLSPPAAAPDLPVPPPPVAAVMIGDPPGKPPSGPSQPKAPRN